MQLNQFQILLLFLLIQLVFNQQGIQAYLNELNAFIDDKDRDSVEENAENSETGTVKELTTTNDTDHG